MEYQPLISAIDIRTEPISTNGLFRMLANFDQKVKLFHGMGAGRFKSSANAAGRGHNDPPTGYRCLPCNKNISGSGRSNTNNRTKYGCPYYSNNKGRQGGGPSNGCANSSSRGYDDNGPCQICNKKIIQQGTAAGARYAKDNSQNERVVGVANASYGVDTNWYADSGAMNHITIELEKLTYMRSTMAMTKSKLPMAQVSVYVMLVTQL